MNRRSLRLIIALALLAALLLWLAWFFSPYWSVRRMGEAARAGDAAAFNDYVDYPALRASLKTQLAGRVGVPGPEAGQDNPLARLGQALGTAMVGGAVDAIVRPETVMLALRSGVLVAPGVPESAEPPPEAPPEAPPRGLHPKPPPSGPRWHYDRHGLSRVLVYRDDLAGGRRGTTFVLGRTGPLQWKLVGLVLPPATARP